MRASETSAIATSRGAEGGATFASHRASPGAIARPPRPSVSVTASCLRGRGRVARLRGSRRFGEAGPLLPGSTVGFVRLHDLLDERVPHHILLVEVHEG